MSRNDQVESEPSAAALLLTLLGEFVLPAADAVWTSTLTDALAVLGVEEKAARQALARSAQRGLLDSEKLGRRVRWRLTPQAVELLRRGSERIYGFGGPAAPWDGRWLLLFCSLPESRRELRYRLRVRLGWAGLAPFEPGAWISPWVDRQADAVAVVRDLQLDAASRCFTASLGSLGDARQIAAEAWDLDELAGAYARFVADLTAPPPPNGDEAAFRALCELVHRWRRFPTIDPDLPAELLPERWPKAAAVELFQERHRSLAPPALRWWNGH